MKSWRSNMAADYLDILVSDAMKTVASGYYKVGLGYGAKGRRSLLEAILGCKHAAIIAEIKPASPSKGKIRDISDPVRVAEAMQRGGAVGISILTEPKYFGGSLAALAKVCENVEIPVLMKDIVLDPIQLEAASTAGASAVLLIYQVFKRGYGRKPLKEMIRQAHDLGLEVLLEIHTKEEFNAALETEADLIGVNNRDLATLKVDLKVTELILSQVKNAGKLVVSESGIQTPDDIRRLHSVGARAFLIGTAVMQAENIEDKVRELVLAI
ncbi:MAG: indole-3-glycerol-phosphate synthase [Candidatus Bathyarchaeia archaeon]